VAAKVNLGVKFVGGQLVLLVKPEGLICMRQGFLYIQCSSQSEWLGWSLEKNAKEPARWSGPIEVEQILIN
jgi:hypothetical protein